MRLNRRAFLPLAGLPLLASGRSARAALPMGDAEAVAAVRDYLQSIVTLTSRFVQVVPNGSQSTGKLWLERPSKLRMVYDAPKRMELITQSSQLVFVDYVGRQVTYLPVSKTPLAFLLSRTISLGGEVTVTKVEDRLGELVLTLVQTENPDQGSVEIGFGTSPMELRRWLVRDVRGRETVIFLEDVVTGEPIPESAWEFRDPKFFGWPSR